ncbi:MAG: hypothetical protein JST91_23280 [Actinobacteria bacterium]|nr:hypothetical protein [Actinomycetota bacterium]
MGRPKRHSQKRAVFSDVTALAASLPEHLRNPNGVGNGVAASDHQQSVAEHLRSLDADEQLAPAVSAATGVTLAMFLRNRLTAAAVRFEAYTATYRPARTQADDEHPDPPYLPPEPTAHTWTDDDDRARMEHRKTLAARPFDLGMATAMTNQPKGT